MIELGGNIKLSGFSDMDNSTLIIIKKLVGNFVKQIVRKYQDIDSLTITRKDVHNTEGNNGLHEIHIKLILGGDVFASEITDRNLYVGLDKVLKKIEQNIEKKKG